MQLLVFLRSAFECKLFLFIFFNHGLHLLEDSIFVGVGPEVEEGREEPNLLLRAQHLTLPGNSHVQFFFVCYALHYVLYQVGRSCLHVLHLYLPFFFLLLLLNRRSFVNSAWICGFFPFLFLVNFLLLLRRFSCLYPVDARHEVLFHLILLLCFLYLFHCRLDIEVSTCGAFEQLAELLHGVITGLLRKVLGQFAVHR